MSFDIEWGKLDDELAGHVQQFLNRHFQTINKPSYIGDIHVTSFGWGTTAPSVEIIDITDPFPEFYEPDDEQDDELDTPKPLSPEEQQQQQQQQQQQAAAVAGSVRSGSVRAPPGSVGGETRARAPSDVYFDSMDRQQQQQQQQQRIQLMNAFHRSPLVAPQHPFSSNLSTPGLFSPGATSPTRTSMYMDRAPPISDHVQDWIDDELLNSGHSVSSARPSIAAASTGKETASNAAPPPPPSAIDPATRLDFQSHLLISYKGDMNMTILTELRMNYPSMVFMSLPIQLKVRSVEFEATAVVAYIQSMRRVCCSLLDTDDDEIFRGKDVVGLKR
ncbi:hypothetical protein BC940DRAFT_118977 [Gongronella butleri]|nr:hypothetical protein BC940DRAFT_118977 [Gongronella butleri]